MEVFIYKNNSSFSANVYLLSHNNHCLLIDCGFCDNNIINDIKLHQCFDGVILTHKHFDHIAGLNTLCHHFPNIKIYSRQTKENFFEDSYLNALDFFSDESKLKINYPYSNIEEGFHTIGAFNIEVRYTPGHTSDSIIIKFCDHHLLFTGDLLFSSSIGRWDLPTANINKLKESIKIVKSILRNEELLIYSGHDNNPFSSSDVFLNNPYINLD